MNVRFENLVRVAGHIALEPRIHDTGKLIKNSDKPLLIVEFPIAINRRHAEGDKPDYVTVKAIGYNALFIEKYLKKGSPVSVLGAMESSRYEDKQGVSQYNLKVLCDGLSSTKNMCANLNQVSVTGRLTKDPTVTVTEKGTIISKFSIALDRLKFGESPVTDFFYITAYNNTAKFVDSYLKKGMKVDVSGFISSGSYQNKDGATVYTTDIIANKISFAENKKDVANSSQDDEKELSPAFGVENDEIEDAFDGFSLIDDEDDDLPF